MRNMPYNIHSRIQRVDTYAFSRSLDNSFYTLRILRMSFFQTLLMTVLLQFEMTSFYQQCCHFLLCWEQKVQTTLNATLSKKSKVFGEFYNEIKCLNSQETAWNQQLSDLKPKLIFGNTFERFLSFLQQYLTMSFTVQTANFHFFIIKKLKLSTINTLKLLLTFR